MTIRRNWFIGYSLASGLQCNGWRCKNLSLRYFYIKLEECRKVRWYQTFWRWGSTKCWKEQLKSEEDRVCICVVWQDEMKMGFCLATPGSPKYILRVARFTADTPVSPDTHRRSLMILFEAVINRVGRCTGRPWRSRFGHALGARDRVNSEMHSEAVTEQVWRCTCRIWSSETGGVLGGCRFGGKRNSSWDHIDWLTCNCGSVESWV